MLTPEYLASCADTLLGMMDIIERQAIEDIARRIIKTGHMTETAEFEARMLREQGALYKDIMDDVGRLTQKTGDEIRSIFEDAGIVGIEAENAYAQKAGLQGLRLSSSPAMMSIIDAHLQKTAGAVQNLTMTTATQSQLSFIQACSMANLQVNSGLMTYQEAIRQAIKQVAADGVTVQYPSGARDKLDVAVRRAVLTGVNQSAAKVSEMYCDEVGADLVETTAHAGARPDHARWQGQVFSRSGTSKKYPDFVSSTGYGTGAGLCGWNCRHSFHAYFDGTPRSYTDEQLASFERKKYDYNGERLTEYEASQIQRKMERDIRALKREATALNAAAKEASEELKDQLQDDFRSASVRLKAKENDLKNFCKQTDRQVDSARTQVHAVRDSSGKVIGFDRSVAQKATAQAKKHEKELRDIDLDEYRKLAEYCRKNCTKEEFALVNRHIHNGEVKGYFQTPNSFRINSMLRQGKLSELSQHDQETVAVLQDIITRIHTQKKYLLHRNDDLEVLESLFSAPIDDVIAKKTAEGRIVTIDQFMSTSMIQDKNLFKKRPVCWEIAAPKGTHGFANGYEEESEFVLGIGQDIEILKILRKDGKIIIKAMLRG